MSDAETALATIHQPDIAPPPAPGNLSFAPRTFAEALQFAELLANSDLVPKDYRGKAGNIVAAVQWGYELGLHPLQAIQNIAVINGRPSLWGDAAIALIRSKAICLGIEETWEGEGDNFRAVCIAQRRGQKPVRREFSVADAKTARLWGKEGTWTTYPKRMLQMRARGFALRDAFPDVLRGLITAEEAMDIPVDGFSPRNEEAAVAAPAPRPALAPPAASLPLTCQLMPGCARTINRDASAIAVQIGLEPGCSTHLVEAKDRMYDDLLRDMNGTEEERVRAAEHLNLLHDVFGHETVDKALTAAEHRVQPAVAATA